MIDLDAQVDAFTGGDRNDGREGVGLRAVGEGGHHAQVTAVGFVVRDVEIVELETVVVADESGELLEVLRLEIDERFGGVAVGLLAAGDERLFEEAADGFASEETKVAGAGGEREELFGEGRAQPLEIDGEFGSVEILARRLGGKRVRREIGRGCIESWDTLAVQGAQPVVGAPDHFLNSGFATEGAAAAVVERAAAEVGEVGVAGLSVAEIGVTGALQRSVGAVTRAHDVGVGVKLVGTVDVFRACHGDGVVPCGAALGDDEVVVAVALVEVRGFGEAERGALEDVGDGADEAAFGDGVFLEDDAGEAVVAGAMVPELVDDVFAAIVIVEERRIETAAVEINGIGPIAIDGGRGDEEVVEVAERRAGRAADGGAAVAFDVGVEEPELAVGVRQARRPDAAGVGIAEHVELARAAERAGEEAPVDEIAGVMDLDAGEPLECRRGDVVVVADAKDGRVGVEAGEDGVADRGDGRGGHDVERVEWG